MEWKQLVDLMREGQSVRTRFFKLDPTFDEIGQWMNAFSNASGGQIVLGLDVKNLHFLGTSIEESALNTFIKQSFIPLPPYKISKVSRNPGYALVIEVKKSVIYPIFFNNAVYELPVDPSQKPLLKPDITPSQDQMAQLDSQNHLYFDTGAQNDVGDMEDDLIDEELETITQELLTIQYDIEAEQQMSLSPDTEAFLNERQKKALEFLKMNSSISNKQYRELFSISHKTAHIELVELVSKGLLLSKGAGRSTCYCLVV